MYKINNIEELKSYFKKNNITNSNNLANLGPEYWNNELKPLINPKLFKKPNTKQELQELINNNCPLLLINTSNITDFEDLFRNNFTNQNLKSKEYLENPMNYLGFWNTSNVKNISSCFFNQINFDQQIYWNTEKVENAKELFFYCFNLNQEIELNLPNCKNISNIFSSCSNLNSSIKLNNLDNVKNAYGLFSNCENFNQPIELNLQKCETIFQMFAGCKNLNSKIILQTLDNVENASYLFFHCENLEFKNIESVINQLIIYFGDIIELEKIIKYYKISEEYKKKINNKEFNVVNQI